ncbi:aminodeoxychorismate lyase [Gryllotalpicola ginsengisoli]|uniref:aminodeoxychorismate lyase n=1 Tax=Gryllotalpicola ginsengisoli TaxID=444608 RepID=UPI0003B742FB|nr:aminodeoxychorismate lyase [Gryllotalpicola ginsengisoli]
MTQPIVFMLDVAPADAPEPEGGWAATVHRVPDGQPSLMATELSATRGDGVFETLGVIDGFAQAVDGHFWRLANSAQLLELPAPNLEQWRAAMQIAAAALPTDRQGGVKLVLSRGVEGSGVPTGWLIATTTSGDFPSRRDGWKVVTLDRGYRHDLSEKAPWLLPGAKTLSYAVNMAALREAARRGADNAIFISSDDYVMEAPQSTVLLRRGNTLITPKTDIGILPGTTQLSVFAVAGEWGFATEDRLVAASDLFDSDGVWLLSSVMLATPITEIDGRAIAVDRDLTDRLNDALLARRE